MIPYWCHLLNPKIMIFKPWDNCDVDCVYVPFKGWMGKTKYWVTFERVMVVGARRSGLCVKNCNAAGFFTLDSFPCVSRMVHHPNDILYSQLDATVGSIGVNMGQHPCGTLLTPCPNELRMFWGQKVEQLNIRKVFLMFCTLSVVTSDSQ